MNKYGLDLLEQHFKVTLNKYIRYLTEYVCPKVLSWIQVYQNDLKEIQCLIQLDITDNITSSGVQWLESIHIADSI